MAIGFFLTDAVICAGGHPRDRGRRRGDDPRADRPGRGPLAHLAARHRPARGRHRGPGRARRARRQGRACSPTHADKDVARRPVLPDARGPRHRARRDRDRRRARRRPPAPVEATSATIAERVRGRRRRHRPPRRGQRSRTGRRTWSDDTSYRPEAPVPGQHRGRRLRHQRVHHGHIGARRGRSRAAATARTRPASRRRRCRSASRRSTDAGIETPSPEDVGDDPSIQPFQAAFQACPDLDLLQAWLEAAGEDLNYGTLEAAIDGLEVTASGDPTLRTYGPPPDADGNPPAYLFRWDEALPGLVLDEG